jgi:ketosteroid isomerase-like protein
VAHEDATETMRRMLAAFNRDDVEAVVATFAEDCVLEEPPEMPDSPAGGFRGHEGIRAWMANLRRSIGTTFEMKALEAIDDAFVVEVVALGRGESSEVPVEWTTYAVVRAQGGKLVRAQAFLSRQEALAAVSSD